MPRSSCNLDNGDYKIVTLKRTWTLTALEPKSLCRVSKEKFVWVMVAAMPPYDGKYAEHRYQQS
jgi:hypothetical protein